MTLLWHEDVPIGICVFCCPAIALRLRTHHFGLKRPTSRETLKWVNRHIWLLSRVVLHPSYRGAGLASRFIRRSCETCTVDYIETLSALGEFHPIFERAGFERIGIINYKRSDKQYARLYGSRTLTAATAHKSRTTRPVYYVRPNRPDVPLTQ